MNQPINLPPMPSPKDFSYDPRDNGSVMGRAKKEYEKALGIWQTTSLEIARILAARQGG